MTLQSISNAAALALVSAFVALLFVKSFLAIAQPFSSARNFAGNIMVEAAQHIRDELDSLRGKQVLYAMLGLIFLASFTTAMFGRPAELLGSQATWQNVLVLGVVTIAAGYCLYHLVITILRRRHLAFVRDATMAVGHSLHSITSNRNRVFHDVPCPFGPIDNVLVGLHGVYMIDVVARRPGKDNRARLVGDEIRFAPGKVSVSVADREGKAKQLAKALGRIAGHAIHVRPVIAVPGWEIESQASDRFLLVNERSVGMLRGWRDEKDYLLNEDVEAIHAHLSDPGNYR